MINLHLVYTNFHDSNIIEVQYCSPSVVHIQEIKFEPNVMCEHVDKKSTFRENQV